MEAVKKEYGLAAITVDRLLAIMAILSRIELILDVISVTRTYAAIVFQFGGIPKIRTASIQRNNYQMQKYKAWLISLTTLSSVLFIHLFLHHHRLG